MVCKKAKASLEQENAELKGKLEKLQFEYDLLSGESLCHKYIADQATKMLSREQKAALSVLLIQRMVEVILTGEIPGDDD
jgi:hypothetical protein